MLHLTDVSPDDTSPKGTDVSSFVDPTNCSLPHIPLGFLAFGWQWDCLSHLFFVSVLGATRLSRPLPSASLAAVFHCHCMVVLACCFGHDFCAWHRTWVTGMPSLHFHSKVRYPFLFFSFARSLAAQALGFRLHGILPRPWALSVWFKSIF